MLHGVCVGCLACATSDEPLFNEESGLFNEASGLFNRACGLFNEACGLVSSDLVIEFDFLSHFAFVPSEPLPNLCE